MSPLHHRPDFEVQNLNWTDVLLKLLDSVQVVLGRVGGVGESELEDVDSVVEFSCLLVQLAAGEEETGFWYAGHIAGNDVDDVGIAEEFSVDFTTERERNGEEVGLRFDIHSWWGVVGVGGVVGTCV